MRAQHEQEIPKARCQTRTVEHAFDDLDVLPSAIGIPATELHRPISAQAVVAGNVARLVDLGHESLNTRVQELLQRCLPKSRELWRQCQQTANVSISRAGRRAWLRRCSGVVMLLKWSSEWWDGR